MARFKLKRKYFGVKEAVQNIMNDKIGPADPIGIALEKDLKKRGIKIIKRKSFGIASAIGGAVRSIETRC